MNLDSFEIFFSEKTLICWQYHLTNGKILTTSRRVLIEKPLENGFSATLATSRWDDRGDLASL